MKVKSDSEVAQSCSTLSDPIDCSLSGSSTHGIFQARILEWGAIAFSDDQPSILKSKDITLLTKVHTKFFQYSCMDVRAGPLRKLRAKELMLLNCGIGEDY